MSQSQTDRATNAPGESYIHGYSDEFQRLHGQRTAALEAGFFLPYLRAGMDLVDCGCGPGSITLDLATLVAPGSVVGIDVAQRQLDYARALAAQRGVPNVRFEPGDVYAMPFPDASFDAAFAHNLLQHVRDPLRALRETRRVLKPGGVVGIQDDDWGAYLWEPATPLLRRGLELFLKVAEANGAGFFYARHQKRRLREAGFVRVEGYAMARSNGTPERLGLFVEAAVRQFQDPAFVATVLEHGWADQETLDALPATIRAWARDPDAYRAILCPAAVGWVACEE
ncbi:MAG TPA: methyltransferase domain-containing protein [Chloroflexota bacterium]|nr:methyltransferase domain-containing protein [Chloroflexota bacterium]